MSKTINHSWKNGGDSSMTYRLDGLPTLFPAVVWSTKLAVVLNLRGWVTGWPSFDNIELHP